jgi:hypothetical protein
VDRGIDFARRNTAQRAAHQFGEVELQVGTHRHGSAGGFSQASDYTMRNRSSGERSGAMSAVSV